MRFQAWNAAAPLTQTPTPSHPWQICALDIFTLDGLDYLIIADFYSKVILVCNLPTGQSSSAKVIHMLEEWFCDHGMPEVLCTENDPEYASAAFADCSTEWGFTHETSIPHYSKSNKFTESCVTINKHTLQCTKYIGTNQGIHYSTSRPPQLMSNFHHPLRCCTTARYVPPYHHPGSAKLSQQPSKFKGTLRMEPSKPSPMLISTPCNLHHSILVSPLQH